MTKIHFDKIYKLFEKRSKYSQKIERLKKKFRKYLSRMNDNGKYVAKYDINLNVKHYKNAETDTGRKFKEYICELLPEYNYQLSEN
jgi:septation ring formation regulator EzrA